MCCACRYEAGELERTQLREAVLKHKAELEALGNEHMEELSALAAAHQAELAVARRQEADLQCRLEQATEQLQHAQVRALFIQSLFILHQKVAAIMITTASCLFIVHCIAWQEMALQ